MADFPCPLIDVPRIASYCVLGVDADPWPIRGVAAGGARAEKGQFERLVDSKGLIQYYRIVLTKIRDSDTFGAWKPHRSHQQKRS
jgi:hypothetical protein